MTIRTFNSLSLFWKLQLIGWTGYAMDRWIQTPNVFFREPFTYLVVAFLLSLGLRAVYRRLWQRAPAVWKVGAVSVICSCIAAYLWLLVSSFSFWLRGLWDWPRESWARVLLGTLEYTLEHHKPFLFLSWSALYFGIKYWQRQQAQETQALRAAALAQEAELQMLRYQLNPHFLFNSLNSATALVREDPAGAERMLNELSEFLRYTLAHAATREVPLRDELEAARKYLAIEQIRFEEKLQVSFDVAPEAENFHVPSLLLQPLVENAVKYGWQTSAMPLQLAIKAHGSAQRLRLEVSNTGRLLNGSTNGAGIGLENVRRRLEQAFPARNRFALNETKGRVTVTLELEKS
jgi:two-component system, LytTR family, sensor kinase